MFNAMLAALFQPGLVRKFRVSCDAFDAECVNEILNLKNSQPEAGSAPQLFEVIAGDLLMMAQFMCSLYPTRP